MFGWKACPLSLCLQSPAPTPASRRCRPLASPGPPGHSAEHSAGGPSQRLPHFDFELAGRTALWSKPAFFGSLLKCIRTTVGLSLTWEFFS